MFGLRDRGFNIVGARADHMVVAGDPTNDIEDTLRIQETWKNGFSRTFQPERSSTEQTALN
jgi:hypothetical protein